ncbi:hypothetical protein XENOCAPTIV_013739, partial [Xenoophorus captivus]
DLMAWRGHRFASDPVDLVEGVGPQQPVVSGADEQLQSQRFALHVAMKLREDKEAHRVVELKNPGLPEVGLSELWFLNKAPIQDQQHLFRLISSGLCGLPL